MPSSIGGDDASAITMDGDDIAEVTMDGDVVWTASQVDAPYDDAIHDWRITEGSGSTLTDSAGSEDLPLPNGGAWVSDSRFHDGTAIELNGSDQYAEGSNLNMQPPFAVIIEFELSSYDDSNFGPAAVAEGRTVSGGDSRAQWGCNHLNSGGYFVEAIDDGVNEYLATGPTPSTGQVYTNGIIIDDEGLKNIFDGSEEDVNGNVTSSDTLNDAGEPLNVGRDGQRDDWYLDGTVGRVTIWDRGLSDSEVSNL